MWSTKVPSILTMNETEDGVNFNLRTRRVLLGQFFFLADDQINHVRQARNIITVLSEVGGLFKIFALGFMLTGKYLSKQKIYME